MSLESPLAPRRIALIAILFCSIQALQAADSVVVFNEINYHPADELNETEWVELRSLMGVDVDMSGWSIGGGVKFVFPEGTVLPGHGYLLIAGDPSNASLAGTGAMGPLVGKLANGGESIRLENNNGRVMDEVSYGDDNDWPVGADGSGATLAKRDQASADARPGNWIASPELGGTPARANFPVAGEVPTTTQPILLDSEWSYRETASPPAAGWQAKEFDDATWPSGDGVFYAGDAQPTGAGEGMIGYWPLDETSGNSASNSVVGGQDAQLVNSPTWLNDPSRGRVLAFDGINDYADAGTIPQPTTSNDFTWAFWAYDQGGATNSVVLGNRYSPSGADFSPREFIKFTPTQFEWHRGGQGENIGHGGLPQNTWVHHAIVKDGTGLTYYRNGVFSSSSSISQGLNNAQPFYFGGDQEAESWSGRLDDPAIWELALPASSIAGLASGAFAPPAAPTIEGAGGGNLQTELALGSTAFYFRNSFAFSGNPARTSLALQLLVDDGAVVYLNGVEVHRENMPGGAVGHATLAASTIGDAALSSGISIPPASLIQGVNVLAVEVHQASAGSGDMVFGATLSATELPPDPSDLESNLVFSEIAAADEPGFQIELTNIGAASVDLAGYTVTSSAGGSYAFPAGALASGAQLSISAATLGFSPVQGDRLFLLRPGQAELADARQVTNRLRGLSADGRWLYPTSPSFGAGNIFDLTSDIVINEIMYNPRPLRASQPAGVVLLDWGATWRYNESGDDLGNAWENSLHPAGGDWMSGPGPLGYETGDLPVPLATTLTQPALNPTFVMTHYFETDFTLSAAEIAGLDEVSLSHLVDDGAIFYLNGQEITRYKMDAEPTTVASQANAGGEAALVSGVSVPKSLFVVGTNRLSVEVHQSSPGSSDIVFGLRLDSTEAFEPFQKSDDQWIELLNRGATPVDLGGWEFTDGISFTFPAGTALGAGEFLVVARDAGALTAKFPGIEILGDWGGNLSRGGERLILRDGNKNIADEVRFFDDGSWPADADGGGASLELIDPDADNGSAGSWEASDEGARSSWQTYSYRASGANHGNDPTQYNEFVFGLLDNGEFLLDDISVVENPDGAARQLIQNGDFSGGNSNFWRLLGTHRHAEVVDDPDSAGNKVLHMATNGSTEHMHNHAETTLKDGGNFVTINGGSQYEISFRAKWLSGSNQFHSRLYFNRAARTTLLDVPDGGGTPGAENSRRVANAGPSFSNLSHTPVVPAAGEAVVVTVDAGDPDSIAGMAVNYSVNGAAFASAAMSDQGGGRWLGTIPGQAGASKIQFYLEATDGGGASSVFPAAGPESAAIIPVEDGQAILDYGDCQPNNLRIVMTDADRDALHTVTNVMSNDRLGCTVIWNESEIYYNCGVRLKGSQRGRAKDVRVGFNLRFPADRLFLGAHKTVAVDRSGAGDQFSQKEIMVKHAINHAGGGIPGMEDDLIRVIAPKSQHTSSAMLLKSRYDSEWLENMYQDGGDGTAWEYELIYYPTSTTGGVEGLKRPNPDSVRGVGVGNLGSDPELYRWHWQIKNNRDADGYASLIEMLQAYGQGSSAQYHEDMRRLLDVDQWLRAFAVQKLFGIGDNYSSGSQHNAIFYQLPDGGKFLYFPWDMDFTFSAGATSSITGPGDLNKLLSDPANERAYYGHIVDIIDTTYNTGYMTPWANHYSCFLPTENLAGFLSYINTRSNSALSQVRNAIPQIPFEVTTGDSDTGGSTFTVQGNGWVDVDEIRLAGTPGNLPITWIDNNTWRVTVPVAPGTNIYTIEGYDQQGNLIDTDSLTLTGTGSVIPAAAGTLVISEIMYSPSAAEGEDADDFEFIELLNTHPSATLDLTGIAFTDGIDFLFPAITLAPGERVVVPRKQAAFQSRYGLGVNVTGQYAAADDSNKLSNGGERLVLEDAVGFEIVSFTYNDKSPWPTAADGEGYSLVLCNPASAGTDPALPVSWRSSRSAGGSPGGFESDLVSDWAAGLGIVDLALDPDADGLSHVAEFFFNTDPFATDSPLAVVESVGGAAVMRVVARNGAEGVEFSGSRSDDLNTWSPANYSGRLNNGDGITSTLIFTGTGLEALREFLRVEISELP